MDRAWVATVHAFQGRTVDRIVTAMPSGNTQLTNQQAFCVAISRARDRADLVTDDAWKLADQLEKATRKQVSALDATAMQAAHEAVFGRDPAHEHDGDQAARASDAMDRGLGDERDAQREQVRERRTERETGCGWDGKAGDRSAGRERPGRDARKTDRGLDRERSVVGGPRRDSEQEKAAEPKHKSRDLDMGLWGRRNHRRGSLCPVAVSRCPAVSRARLLTLPFAQVKLSARQQYCFFRSSCVPSAYDVPVIAPCDILPHRGGLPSPGITAASGRLPPS